MGNVKNGDRCHPCGWFQAAKIDFLEESGGCNQQKMGMNQPKWMFEQILSDLTATFGFGLGILVRTIRLV